MVDRGSDSHATRERERRPIPLRADPNLLKHRDRRSFVRAVTAKAVSVLRNESFQIFLVRRRAGRAHLKGLVGATDQRRQLPRPSGRDRLPDARSRGGVDSPPRAWAAAQPRRRQQHRPATRVRRRNTENTAQAVRRIKITTT